MSEDILVALDNAKPISGQALEETKNYEEERGGEVFPKFPACLMH